MKSLKQSINESSKSELDSVISDLKIIFDRDGWTCKQLYKEILWELETDDYTYETALMLTKTSKRKYPTIELSVETVTETQAKTLLKKLQMRAKSENVSDAIEYEFSNNGIAFYTFTCDNDVHDLETYALMFTDVQSFSF